METRKVHATKPSDLPADYVKMVNEVFTANFDAGLKTLKKFNPAQSRFATTGRIYAGEIILAVSLLHEGQLAATTVYASSDYDSQASSPTIQDVLGACVDAVATIYGQLLSPDQPEVLKQVADQSLSAMESAPFEWTEFKVEKFKIYLKVDKANPDLDRIADSWLDRHDPNRAQELDEEEKATENLFVTGPKKPRENH